MQSLEWAIVSPMDHNSAMIEINHQSNKITTSITTAITTVFTIICQIFTLSLIYIIPVKAILLFTYEVDIFCPNFTDKKIEV